MSATLDPRVIPVTSNQPEENKIYPIAVIGAGAGGTMAANRAVLNNNEVLLFTGAKQELRRSRGNWVRKVDNVPGLGRYSRTVLELRNEVLEGLTQSSLGHNLFVIQDSIHTIEKQDEFFKLTDGNQKTYFVRYVVLATGIMDEQPHIQGSIKPILKYANGQTAAYCILCDGHQCYHKKSVVIGHSPFACETALLLVDKYSPTSMTLVTNGNSLDLHDDLQKKFQEKNIQVVQEPILKVLGNEEQKKLSGFQLESGQIVEAEMAFVALGIRPNNQLALQLGAEVDERGLVMTDSKGESSIPNLFVIGDLRSGSLKQIYVAWEHAVESVQLINHRLRE